MKASVRSSSFLSIPVALCNLSRIPLSCSLSFSSYESHASLAAASLDAAVKMLASSREAEEIKEAASLAMTVLVSFFLALSLSRSLVTCVLASVALSSRCMRAREQGSRGQACHTLVSLCHELMLFAASLVSLLDLFSRFPPTLYPPPEKTRQRKRDVHTHAQPDVHTDCALSLSLCC